MNKSDILKRVASITNGEATVPTGDEYDQWSEYLESANQEWPQAYDPQVLIKKYYVTASQSGTSVALPSDFKEKFAGFIDLNGDKWEEFDMVEATIASGKYVTWGGNQSSGYHMTFSQALTSQTSVMVPYHSRPTSLSTLTSISPIPDPEFLVARTAEMVFFNRGQAEYQEMQRKADLLLQRMVSNEVSTELQRNKGIRTQMEYDNFIIGED